MRLHTWIKASLLLKPRQLLQTTQGNGPASQGRTQPSGLHIEARSGLNGLVFLFLSGSPVRTEKLFYSSFDNFLLVEFYRLQVICHSYIASFTFGILPQMVTLTNRQHAVIYLL